MSSDTNLTSSDSEPTSPETNSTSSDSESTSSDTNPTSSPKPDTANTEEPQHTLLLTRDAVPHLLAKFGLKESAAGADLYRAVEQARVRVESRRLEL